MIEKIGNLIGGVVTGKTAWLILVNVIGVLYLSSFFSEPSDVDQYAIQREVLLTKQTVNVEGEEPYILVDRSGKENACQLDANSTPDSQIWTCYSLESIERLERNSQISVIVGIILTVVFTVATWFTNRSEKTWYFILNAILILALPAIIFTITIIIDIALWVISI